MSTVSGAEDNELLMPTSQLYFFFYESAVACGGELEHQSEGYFNKLFVDQVSRSLTEDVGMFIFDNAQSHLKKLHHCLNPDKMNVSDGGKLPFLRDTV